MFLVDKNGEMATSYVSNLRCGIYMQHPCVTVWKLETGWKPQHFGVRKLLERRKSNSWNHKLINADFQEHSFNCLLLMISE
jgi:hypothetical protein